MSEIVKGMTISATRSAEANNNSVAVQRIVLTGFMGSGKSTVGAQVAKQLRWRFLDVDEVIVTETGMPISQYFAKHGEPAFRNLERATIERLCREDEIVLALGGGAIETEATLSLLLHAPGTLLAHLEVALETTLKRCRGTEHMRPVLADRANLAARYQRRLPLYRLAHVSIPVDDLTVRQAVQAVLRAAGSQG